MKAFELINTEYFDQDAIRLPDYKVGRVNYGRGRSYVKIMDGELEQPFRLYTSLTTAINTCAPMEDTLLQWYCKHGYEEANRLVRLSQEYGTLMHIEIGKYLMMNYYDFDQVDTVVQEYLNANNFFDKGVNEWAENLKYDVTAFIAFAQEHNVKPLGIEYVLLSDKYGFGTLIDLVCKMTIVEKGFFGEVYKSGEKKGGPKESKREREITACINFKSGRHQFYRSNGIQAVCEKMLWEENFPDVPLEATYNWSPKDWISVPSYNLKDWTGEVELAEIVSILSLAELRFGDRALNKKYTSITGQAFSTRPVTDCIKQTTVEKYCAGKYSNLMTA